MPKKVPLDVIRENDYNLNISRYVSTAKPEEPVNLDEVHSELQKLEDEIKAAKAKHNSFLKELNLKLLP